MEDNEILKRFWSYPKETSDKLLRAVDAAIDDLLKIHEAPSAAQENLMKTIGKNAANIINFAGRTRQAESGMMQALVVNGERRIKSKEYSEYSDYVLPQLSTPKKLKAKND
jgi:hypothetical protein